MCVIAVPGIAPCQCFSPGGQETTSPGRIAFMGPPELCTQPQPEVTMRVWRSGCVCQLLRAPGSKVTYAPLVRAGAGARKSWSMRTVPVKYSAGPLADACDPFFLSSMSAPLDACRAGPSAAGGRDAL